MKALSTVLIVFSLTLLNMTGLHAQSKIVSLGADISGAGGTASYSIGQVFYTVIDGPAETVFQGIQIPFENLIISSSEILVYPNLEVTISPNPTPDQVNLEFNSLPSDQLFYQLYDSRGKVLSKQRILDLRTTISVSDLPNGMYFLQVAEGTQRLTTFKIVKTN
jgi:hypothetical protein